MRAQRTALRSILVIAVLTLWLAPSAVAAPAFQGGELLIKFKAGASQASIDHIMSDLGATTIRRFGRIGVDHKRISGAMTVAQAIARYRNHPAVEFIEPNYIVSILRTPDDLLFPNQWALRNSGQSGGVPGADIGATEAWDLTTGSHNVVVGVIDTGVDYTHPDLAGNIFVNTGETPGNGLDDDGNGFVDDVRGWDFINRDNDPMDDNGHGTHVAGTIGAVGDNHTGVAGVCWSVRLMPLKFLSSGGSGTTADAIAAINYAVQMGVDILNNSWGGSSYSEALRSAIESANAAGILFVASAGNSASNNDIAPAYPASYDVANIISVAASDAFDQLAGFSNYGVTSVDLAAPGVLILSTLPFNGYGELSGTSMAAPHVSGTLALILAQFPTLNAAEAKTVLLQSVEPLSALSGRVLTGGRLDAARALEGPDGIDPGPILDLAAAGQTSNSITLQWTAPGDDGAVGTVTSYDVRFATFQITDANFDSATPAPSSVVPQQPGSTERAVVPGLAFDTAYYFAVKALDEYDNRSVLSNVVSATTLGPPEINISPTELSAALLTGGSTGRTLTLSNPSAGTLDFTLGITPGPPPSGATPPTPPSGPGGPATGGPSSPPWSEFALAGVATPIAPTVAPTGAASTAVLPGVIADPPGDGAHVDLIALRGLSVLDELQVEMEFSTTISPMDFGGFLSLDIDQNPATGLPPNFGNGFQDVGVEYEFQLFSLSSGVVTLYNLNTGAFIASVPVEIGPRSLRFSAPLSLLGNDDGSMNVSGVVGGASGPTDWFPDTGHGTIQALGWLSFEPGAGTVPPGGSMDINVALDATGLFGGGYDASIHASSNDPDESEVLVPVHLDVTGAPDIALSTPTLNFGPVFTGYSRPLSVVVSNVGTDLLTITGLTATPADYSVASGGFSLAPGETLAVTVTFAPQSATTIDGTLTIASNDHDEGVVTVALHGSGVVPPDVDVTPTSLSAALLTGESTTRTLTVRNTGGSDLDFSVRPEPSEGTPVSTTPVPVPESLRVPTGNQTQASTAPPVAMALYEGIHLRFGITQFGEIMPFQSPLGNEHLALGTFLAGYTVAYMAGGTDHVAYAVNSERVGMTPVSYQEIENTPSSVRVEVVTQTADGVLRVRRLFTFRRDQKYVGVLTEVRNLSPGVVGQVVFKEAVDWDMDADFSDDGWNYDLSRHMVYAWDQHYAAVGADQAPHLMDIYGWNDYASRQTIIDVPAGPVQPFDGLELLHFELGDLAASQTRPVRLAYGVGSTLAELQSILDRAVGVPWLSVEPTDGTVPPGGSVDLNVTFDAASLFGGGYNASIHASSNDPDESEVLVPVHLDVTGAPDIALSTPTLNFGPVFTGYSRPLSVVVSNVGTDLLMITGLTATPADYGVASGGFSLAPGETLAVMVTFAPQSATTIDGTLTIASNDHDEGVVTVALQGSGVVPPDVDVTPTSLSAALLAGENTTRTLTVRNTGGSDLTFTVSERAAAVAAAINSDAPLAKGVQDPRVGNPVTQGTGGPDLFGYQWKDSDEAGGPSFSWIDITSVGTSIPISGDDQMSSPIAMGFPFSFYGTTFTTFRVCTNGFLSFTSDVPSFSNEPLPALFGPENMVAAFWDDLFFSGGSSAYYHQDGTRMVVQFNSVFHLSGGGPYTFEIILYRTGEIRYQYLSMAAPLNGATIGIQNGDKTDGLTVAFNTPYIHDNLAVRLAASPLWLAVSPTSGTVPPGGSMDINVALDATGLFGGGYDASIHASSNDPDESEVLVPVHLDVTGAPDIALSTPTLNFGPVFTGYSRPLSVVVSNVGTDLLTITGLTATPADYSVASGGFSLAPGETLAVTVTFAPQSATTIDGTLTIASNDHDEGVVTVALHGSGVVPPDVDVTPTSLSAALLTGESTTRTLTVRNTGGSDLDFSVRPEPSEGTPVSTTPVPVPESLRVPTGNQTQASTAPPVAMALYEGIHLRFGITQFGEIMPFQSPLGNEHLALGTFLAGYTVAYMAGGTDHVAYAVNSERVGMTPVSYQEIENTPSSVRVEVVTQTADGVLRVRRLFTFRRDQKYVGVLTEVRNLSPGVVGQVVFKEAVDWDMDADFSDDGWNYDLSRHMVYAWDQHYAAVGADQAPHLMDIYGWNDYASRQTIIDVPAGPVQPFDGLELLHFELGDLAASQTRPVRLAYGVGSTLAELQSILDRAVGVPWLSVEPTDGTVPPGGSVDLNVTFDTLDFPAGDYAGQLLVESNDPDELAVAVPASLHITGIPVISIEPASLDFGLVFVGGSASRTLVVENSGTETLSITDVSSNEGLFSANLDAFNVAPNARQDLVVTFRPTGVGIRDGMLAITHNAAGSPTLIPLSGSGILPPVLTYSPDSLQVSLNPGAVSTEIVTIGNVGGSDLHFLLEPRSPSAPPPAPLASGGLDRFGHRWIDSDSPGGPVFNWVNTTGGTQIPLLGDEVCSGPIPIGFPFRFFGVEYTSVQVSTNGWLSFTTCSAGPGAGANTFLPSAGAPENLLAVFWDDLLFDGFSTAIHHNNGERFVVQFNNVQRVNGGGPYTFEVVLYPSGKIVYQYLSMPPGALAGATIGIQNGLRDDGLTVVFNDDYVHDRLAIEFTTGLPWLTLSPLGGVVPPGESTQVRAFLRTAGLPPGDHTGVIDIYSNEVNAPTRPIPVTLHVRGDDPPVVSAPSSATGAEGALLAVDVTASDPDGDPMFSLSAAPLPTGATFTANDAKNAGALRWTPDFDQAGVYAVTLSATSARHAGPVSGPVDPLFDSAVLTLDIANTDRPPVVLAPASLTVAEGLLLAFTVTASDPDGDPVATLQVGDVPVGATYDPDPVLPRGVFTWTPTFEGAGEHHVTFTASNALSGSATTTITVTNLNRPPVADAGGPYVGMSGVPIVFDGSESVDPDGEELEFTWDFGDGDSGSGPTPSHAYTSMTGSPFTVTLTVSDGSLSGTATTTATVQDIVAANVFFPFNLNYIFPQILPAWVRIEPTDGSFRISDVILSSVTMSYNGMSILTTGKNVVDGDRNHNGIAEARICFARNNLRTLFANLPNGTSNVDVTLEGNLMTGGSFRGAVMVHVIKFGFLGTGSFAQVSPNPLNPQATLTFVTTEPGTASAQLFDLHGRLVRDLVPRQFFMPGAHQVAVDGRNEQGNRLASGVYYYRVQTVNGTSKGAITVLK